MKEIGISCGSVEHAVRKKGLINLSLLD